jgi:uncharacterized PurR-regulated membrane protein YhhQ (DUF165 family)
MRLEKEENNIKWIFAILYCISILFGNLAVSYFGIIHAFGLMFPAGAIFIGLTFSLRDFVQREFGHNVWYFMIISMIITTVSGIYLSNLPIPMWKIAIASSVAFIVSEAVDWLVYTLISKNMVFRITISNFFSTPIDSILFVGIAFGSFNFFDPPVYGQAIIKYMSGLSLLPLILNKKNRL